MQLKEPINAFIYLGRGQFRNRPMSTLYLKLTEVKNNG